MIPGGFVRVLEIMSRDSWDPDPFCGAENRGRWVTNCGACDHLLHWLIGKAAR